MTAIANNLPLEFVASDVTRQRKLRIKDAPRDATVREVVQTLLGRMGLMQRDAKGEPLHYRALLESEGRHLHDSELAGDVIKPDSEIVLQPRISAG